MGSLLQLLENLAEVGVPRESIHDLEFGELDVDRVVVLAEEDLDLVLENGWATLDDEEDVSESDVLNLGTGGEKSNWRNEDARRLARLFVSQASETRTTNHEPNGGPIFLSSDAMTFSSSM